MKVIHIIVALALLIGLADAGTLYRPDQINTSQAFPSITMDEDANITLDGGYVIDAKLSGSSAFVTLGTEDWCDYKLDGSGDSTDIQAALNVYKNIYIIGSSTEYDIDSYIEFGAGRCSITGIEYNGYRPTVKADSATSYMFYSNNADADIDISGIVIDANSKDMSPIRFDGISEAKIDNCVVENVLQSASPSQFAVYVVLAPQFKNNTTRLTNCEFFNNLCGGIYITGGYKGNTLITDNTWQGGKPYGNQAYPAIYSDGATISRNTVIGYGNKSQVYEECVGSGIQASDSIISNNYVEGVGSSGIVPGFRSVVDGNRIISPGSNGIDFWYSSYVTVSNNYIENVGNYDESTSAWDQSGIDISDHSEHSLVVGNYIFTNVISDTLAGNASIGDTYITVTHPEYWHIGLRINLTGDLYRIDDIDFTNSRLYLVTSITGNKSSSSAVVSKDCCNFGIQFGDNGAGGGFHTIQGNHVLAGRTAYYGTMAGSSILPYTYCDAYIYPSEPTFMQDDNKIFTYKDGGNYYIGTYIFGIDSKSVQIT